MAQEPITKESLLQSAKRALDDGRLERAISEYQRCLALDPADQRVRLRLAELLVRHKQIPLAVKTYEAVADAYMNDGFYLKAVTVYKNLLRINPSQHSANLALAELYEKMGLAQDAIHQYQILLRHYQQKGTDAQILDLRRRIVALDPEHVTARIRLAETYQLHGDESSSVREYEILAEKLRDTGTREQLIDLYQKILSRRPDHLELLRRLCHIYAEMQDWRTLLTWLTNHAKLVAQDAELLRLQAQVHTRLNQSESARGKWKDLAELYVAQGQESDALAAYEEMLILSPDDAEEIHDAIDRLAPGEFDALTARTDTRRAALVQAEIDAQAGIVTPTQNASGGASDSERANTTSNASGTTQSSTTSSPANAASTSIAAREAKARAEAAHHGGRVTLSSEECDALYANAEACVQLAKAYQDMELADDARAELAKAKSACEHILATNREHACNALLQEIAALLKQ